MTEHQTLEGPSEVFERVSHFALATCADDIPDAVLETAAMLVLDLIGVAAAAHGLEPACIARDHAVGYWAAGEGGHSGRLPFDGRTTSIVGLGFALATQIDNLDAHDGWQPSKGHAGAALLPALIGFAEAADMMTGREALTHLVIGYEIAYRAAEALHATVSDYHTSGAWNSLGCAAIGARGLNLTSEQFRHALGIAEYHGPRSQMMREIANPTMLHDGTGWGAPTGIYAALIAKDGFRGAPAATVEFQDAAFAWTGLGERWLTCEQYIKPYPTCRWAHAPIDAALQLREAHDIETDAISQIEIETFKFSADLSSTVPISTEQAQYSLGWPVAAALVRGRVGVNEVSEDSFSDPLIIAMLNRIEVRVSDELEAKYPDHRLARVKITLDNGQSFDSGVVTASGGPVPQPTNAEVSAKFQHFAGATLSKVDVDTLQNQALALTDSGSDFKILVDALANMRPK